MQKVQLHTSIRMMFIERIVMGIVGYSYREVALEPGGAAPLNAFAGSAITLTSHATASIVQNWVQGSAIGLFFSRNEDIAIPFRLFEHCGAASSR